MKNSGLIALLFLSFGLSASLNAQDNTDPQSQIMLDTSAQPEINNNFDTILNQQLDETNTNTNTNPISENPVQPNNIITEPVIGTQDTLESDAEAAPVTLNPDTGEMPFITEDQQSAIDAGLIDPDFLKEEGKSFDNYNKVTLRFLNKITSESETFDLDIGKTVAYGTLRFRPMACKKSPPIEEPESAAFLQIWEKVRNNKDQWIFSGWMFASSPSLSAMEHPIYDVWVTDCKD